MTLLPSLLTHAQASRYRGLKRSKARKQEGLFLLEGLRLCEDALQSRLSIEACITSKGFDGFTIPPDVKHYEATPTQIEQISDSKSPQGIICVARIPRAQSAFSPTSVKLMLVLDRLSDPGNMGTIFRSALWFGIHDILLGPDCVDPFSPKVVRSSMGAIASLNIHSSPDLLGEALEWQAKGGIVVALHMTGNPIQDFKPKDGLFLVIGSEAHGVEKSLLDIAETISIEKVGVGESLNAAMATSIALYELTR